MKKQQIKNWIEEVLNGSCVQMPTLSIETAHEQFLFNCAKRLVRAFELSKHNPKFHGDFCIALRNYLLTFQTKISSSIVSITEEDNCYGIWKDPETDTINAAYQFPDYINASFAQKAFLSEDYNTINVDEKSNLQTDPLIYRTTGFTRFRSLAQKIAIYGALDTPEGYTALISLPTGGGKSLITQAVSYQKEGLTIIIVPTVSLAIDQVRVAHKIIKSGIPEEEIFYYSSGVEAAPILHAIKSKKAKMLFISPEALLLNNNFVTAINEANTSRYLRNIIIDEAHIVVDWGADFRIDYQCLESWRKKLLLHNPSIRTILLSATFERRCRDILKMFFSEDEKWIEVRCDSLRHEPRYILTKCRSNTEKKKRIIELVRKCPHPLVVYVARPDDAEQIKELLHENGINNVNTFTGLTTNANRQELIRSWVNDEFDVMVATSAFGVGVDKGDIRTVLHAYIPPNPNAYYQELGRGGRDQLPCLSVMCMIEDDINISFQRITKKVMTTEKIIGRWDSLYNSVLSKRVGNLVMIDTTIKPKYSIEDELDDSPASEADVRWNVYVLLFLRRYKKIRIEEVLIQGNGYIFVVEVIDDSLRNNDSHLETEIELIRSQEWHYYLTSFETMRKAIQRNGKECWSEMFYETYDKVFEYCAGCAAHNNPIVGDLAKFALKVSVRKPLKEIEADQLSLFGDSEQLIIRVRNNDWGSALKALSKQRLACIIVPEAWDNDEILMNNTGTSKIMILDINEFNELVNKESWFFISGLIAIIYQGSDHAIYNQLKTILNKLQGCSWTRIIHIIGENTYFEWLNKSFTDLLDGRYIQAESLGSI